MTQPQDSVLSAGPQQLASLMGMDAGAARAWRPEEMGAVLRHQLAAPLRVDLGGLDRCAAARTRSLADAGGLLLKSFGDLLRHPCPPVELLELTKDYAKRCRQSPRGPLPRDVATVLYYATIAAARVRLQTSISRLDGRQLREGFAWVIGRPWVDAETAALVREAAGALEQS